MKGFGLRGFRGGAEVPHRCVSDRLRSAARERIWVLHAFQKKAKQGIKTPKKELDLIAERLKRLKKELRQ